MSWQYAYEVIQIRAYNPIFPLKKISLKSNCKLQAAKHKKGYKNKEFYRGVY
jgi:hypothetical protein